MSKKRYRIPSRRQRVKGFKVHAMAFLGVIGFQWFIYLFTSPGGYPWPMWPMMGWGLGLFFHYVGAIMAPRWSDDYVEEPDYQQEQEKDFFEEKISSEYRMDEPEEPPRRRKRSSNESWDGVDVRVHDVDDKPQG